MDWPTEKDQPGPDQPNVYPDIPQQQAPPPTVLPPLPPGKDLPPNVTATDAISQTLNSLPPQQILDVLTQVKAMAISEPARLTELLKAAPQLSYAIFQALILMNLVDPKILGQVVEQASNAPRPQQPPMPQMPPQPTPQPQYAGYPPPQLPPQHQQYPPPRPPPQQPPHQYPPPQATPQPQPQQPIDQNALLAQVLQMDQRTIDALPPHERQQIMAIRHQMSARYAQSNLAYCRRGIQKFVHQTSARMSKLPSCRIRWEGGDGRSWRAQ